MCFIIIMCVISMTSGLIEEISAIYVTKQKKTKNQ